MSFAGGGTVDYKYDPFGRRIYRSGPSGTTIWLYDGANIVEELDGSGTVQATYTQGSGVDEPLAMLRGATTDYYEADGLGSVTSLTDSTGVIVETYTYDAYGNLTAGGTSLTNPFRYTGREWDQEAGLYYYRARYYEPVDGRFLSEDWMMIGPNAYSYVGNAPLTYVDPSGHLQLEYSVKSKHQGFWESLWIAGEVEPHYRWHSKCTKQCDKAWKVNLTLNISFDMTYSSESNRKHEQGHIDLAKAFFEKHRSNYEGLELTFASEAECKHYVRNRLNNKVLGQLKSDQKQLDEEQSNYDGFWGYIFNHAL